MDFANQNGAKKGAEMNIFIVEDSATILGNLQSILPDIYTRHRGNRPGCLRAVANAYGDSLQRCQRGYQGTVESRGACQLRRLCAVCIWATLHHGTGTRTHQAKIMSPVNLQTNNPAKGASASRRLKVSRSSIYEADRLASPGCVMNDASHHSQEHFLEWGTL